MINEPVVSICIPTNNRPYILKETLNSIISQNCSRALYEICISDGSSNNETQKIIEKYFKYFENIKYKRSNCGNSYNLIEALKLGNGRYLKLHNDYCKFKNENLVKFINFLNQNDNKNILMFFALGSLSSNTDVIIFDKFNSFLDNVGIQATWSPTFCISKYDFDNLMGKKIKVEMMFPHLSLLYGLSDKEMFLVNNINYIENIPLEKKGGYNLPNTFANIYLGMTESLVINGEITEETFNNIKKKILRFVAVWYAEVKMDERYVFSFEDYHNILKKYYGKIEIMEFYMWHFSHLLKLIITKKLKNFLKTI